MHSFNINTIASWVSVISAGFSFFFFCKNKTIRKQILGNFGIKKFEKYESKSVKVISEIKKYSALNGNSKTLDFQKLIKNLKDYYEIVKEVEAACSQKGKKQIEVQRLEIKEFITSFSTCKNNAYKTNLKEINGIYFTIIELDANIKKQSEAKIFR